MVNNVGGEGGIPKPVPEEGLGDSKLQELKNEINQFLKTIKTEKTDKVAPTETTNISTVKTSSLHSGSSKIKSPLILQGTGDKPSVKETKALIKNPWLRPSAAGQIFIILMEVAGIQMVNKLKERLNAVTDLLRSWESAKSRAALTEDIHAQRAAKQLNQAIMSFISAGISFTTSVVSIKAAPKLAKKQALESLAKGNPKARAGLAQKNADKYKAKQAKLEGKIGKLKTQKRTANAAEQKKLTKEIKAADKEHRELEVKKTKEKEIVKKMVGDINKERVSEKKAAISEDTDFRPEFDAAKAKYYENRSALTSQNIQIINMLHQALTSFVNGLQGVISQQFELQEGVLERMKTELEGMDRIIQKSWDNATQNAKEMSDAINEAVQTMKQMMEKHAQTFGKW